jgi:hypothetical protein
MLSCPRADTHLLRIATEYTHQELARLAPDLEEARQAFALIVKDGNRAGEVIRRIHARRDPRVALTRGEATKNRVSVRTDQDCRRPDLAAIAACGEDGLAQRGARWPVGRVSRMDPLSPSALKWVRFDAATLWHFSAGAARDV